VEEVLFAYNRLQKVMGMPAYFENCFRYVDVPAASGKRFYRLREKKGGS
jgi:hypothetical protein